MAKTLYFPFSSFPAFNPIRFKLPNPTLFQYEEPANFLATNLLATNLLSQLVAPELFIKQHFVLTPHPPEPYSSPLIPTNLSTQRTLDIRGWKGGIATRAGD